MKKITLFIVAHVLFSVAAKAQVSQADFAALVAIYNSTHGDEWDNNDNWDVNGTADNVTNDWYGITVDGGRVTRIDLSDNDLDGIMPGEIEYLTALKYLDISDNSIDVIGSSIGALTALEHIDISWNSFYMLSPEIFNITSLRFLNMAHISEYGIANLPSAIGKLTLLDTLDLSFNQLNTLPDKLWGLTALKKLDLDNNDFTNISAEIDNLNNLSSLSLANNELASLPAELWNMTSLASLSLYDNLLTSIPPEISNMQSLSYLYLSNNQLTSLPDELGNITTLRSIRSANNKIASMPDLSQLPDLFILEIQENDLGFGDLEDINVDMADITIAKYSPQAKVEVKLTYENNQATLEILDKGSNNVYQWYKDNQVMNGENTNTLIVSDEDESEYYCIITNSDFPDLTLQSETIIPTSANVFDVVFIVSGGDGVISSASVSLENYGTVTTDASGVATFEDIEPASDISYTITADGYEEYTSSVSVTNKDEQVEVSLVACNNVFDVVFTISDEDGVVSSASVSLENYGTITTNASGVATFEDVEPADNISYTITADGYVEYTSSVSVTDEDIQVNVSLITTSINEFNTFEASLFPNPSNGKFTINLGQIPLDEYELKIFNLTGKQIHKQKLEKRENRINIGSKQENGIYVIEIKTKKGVCNTYKLIINR